MISVVIVFKALTAFKQSRTPFRFTFFHFLTSLFNAFCQELPVSALRGILNLLSLCSGLGVGEMLEFSIKEKASLVLRLIFY